MNYTLICSLAMVLLGSSAGSLSAAPSSQNRSLRGVTTVRVIVEDLNQVTQKTGLRKEHLLAVAEKQLSDSGLAVLRPQEPGKVPIVYIRLSSVIGGEEGRAPLSFYLVVQVKQLARLAHEQRLTCGPAEAPDSTPLLVTTWEQGTMVMLDRVELFLYVRATLTNLLDELVRNYQEMNGSMSAG